MVAVDAVLQDELSAAIVWSDTQVSICCRRYLQALQLAPVVVCWQVVTVGPGVSQQGFMDGPHGCWDLEQSLEDEQLRHCQVEMHSEGVQLQFWLGALHSCCVGRQPPRVGMMFVWYDSQVCLNKTGVVKKGVCLRLH